MPPIFESFSGDYRYLLLHTQSFKAFSLPFTHLFPFFCNYGKIVSKSSLENCKVAVSSEYLHQSKTMFIIFVVRHYPNALNPD